MKEYINSEVIQNFLKICTIPHGSGDTAKLREFLKEYAIKCKFSVNCDDAGNIHAIKGKPKICLQAHYDMVCVGLAPNLNVKILDDEILMAENSSLGADNGMGVAIIMVMMKEFENLEILLTNDEEIGLLGANAFKGTIKSQFLLNLDTERDDEVIIGCAGDAKLEVSLKADYQTCDDEIYEINVAGLKGGHSGVQIDENIANPIKDVAKFITQNGFKITEFNGGERINSLPTSVKVKILSNGADLQNLNTKISHINFIGNSGENFTCKVEKLNQKAKKYISNATKFLNFINAFSQGVRSYDKELKMVVSSINLSLVKTDENGIKAKFFARACDMKTLENIIFEMKTLANLSGLEICVNDVANGWEPVKSDFANDVANELMKYKQNVKITAVHAGLECGVLKDRGENLQVCSIGPNITAPHSTGERCEISSVEIIENVVRNLLKKYI